MATNFETIKERRARLAQERKDKEARKERQKDLAELKRIVKKYGFGTGILTEED